MADPNDITTSLEATESDVLSLKKDHYAMGGGTRTPAPVQINTGLNEELLQMLKMGKRFNQFQGIDRCIRVLEPNTPNQRHCMSMMVKDMSRNMVVCSSCDRIRDLNANPKTINSSMIKLSPKELEEFKFDKDPLENAKPAPVKKVKEVKEPVQRKVKVKTPDKVVIEMSMESLKKDDDVIKIMLQKTLEAVFELPVTKFSESEGIREVSERIKTLLNENARESFYTQDIQGGKNETTI